jgi:hypothetical protein
VPAGGQRAESRRGLLEHRWRQFLATMGVSHVTLRYYILWTCATFGDHVPVSAASHPAG